MATRHLVVHLGPVGHSSDSFVELDGERVKNCRAVTIRSRVGEATTVTLELINVKVDFDSAIEDEDVERA